MSNFTFENTTWLTPVILGALVIWFAYAIKELRSGNKKNRVLKLGIALIAVVSLAGMALKPQQVFKLREKPVILLTENHQPETLDSLKKIYKRIKTLRYAEVKHPELLSEYNPIYVLGSGIPEYQLEKFSGTELVYLGGQMPEGVLKLKYAQQVVKGKDLIIEGDYHGAQGTRLLLESAAGTALDSVDLKDSVSKFLLSANATTTGNFLYMLIEKDTLGKIINSNPLPITVIDQNPLKILVLNGFPTFETKYLKNFLAEAGHEVIVRSQVSKGRYKFEYFNTASSPVNRLDENHLEKTDLVIMDVTALGSLSSGELTTLREAIHDQGLGLLIQTEENPGNIPVKTFLFDLERDGKTEIQLGALNNQQVEKSPFHFTTGFDLYPVHQQNNQLISVVKRFGAGRIGATVLQNTYELILKGKANAYKKVWSSFTEALAKRAVTQTRWDDFERFAYKDEPFSINLRTTVSSPVLKTSEGYTIGLKENLQIPYRWEGTTYPTGKGWQSAFVTGDSLNVYPYYVMEEDAWSSLKQFRTMNANAIWLQEKKTREETPRSIQPINLWWFYIPFLLATGYLWLEPKL